MNRAPWSTSAFRAAAAALLVVSIAAGCGDRTTVIASPSGAGRADGSPTAGSPGPDGGSPAVGPSGSVPSATAPIGSGSTPASSTGAEVVRLQALVVANPADEQAQRDLGFALVQRVRETADPSLYAPALAAFDAARVLSPDDAEVLAGIAAIQLGKHQFADGLKSAEAAIALSPGLVSAHAAKVDALVELGRYDAADSAAGVMFGLRSDLTTLARVSYLAELRGHLSIALIAMREAAASPGLAPENTAFVQALLGNLLVWSGHPTDAETAYETALALVPSHAPSLAGQGRLAVAAGRLDDAMALFQRASNIVPLPEYVIALGDAQTAAGLTDDAARSYALARAEIQLFKAAGVVVDVDLALLEADHGDPAKALVDATAGYAATPTVRAADALAWAFHRLGRDAAALKRSEEALRLGSIDPILRYHAGAIEAALGDVKAARHDLELALRTDSGFSASAAAEARRLLATLP